MNKFSILESVFGWVDECLTNLKTLIILSCASLTTLFLNIKYITTLEILLIQSCEQLYLTEGEEDLDVKFSLQALSFVDLPQLEVLPRWIEGSTNTLKELKKNDY